MHVGGIWPTIVTHRLIRCSSLPGTKQGYPDPNLAVVIGTPHSLLGYLPWHTRLTEILWVKKLLYCTNIHVHCTCSSSTRVSWKWILGCSPVGIILHIILLYNVLTLWGRSRSPLLLSPPSPPPLSHQIYCFTSQDYLPTVLLSASPLCQHDSAIWKVI